MSQPRAAYIHVPFCRHRCGYCTFTLIAGRDDLIQSYLQAIERELTGLRTARHVDTLYVGGGTPTHLQAAELCTLLQLATRWFPVDEGGEFTVEANPADIDDLRIDVLASAGVNRVSLGAQSFDAQKLRMLERDHTGAQVQTAMAALQPVIPNVSLDLIFGAPGESRAVWSADLRSALTLNPTHLSTYGLTFERGTRFWSRRAKGELAEVETADEARMYETAIETLSAAGYEHYEISSFAQPGFRSCHNQVYWTGREYFGAGPGAARYVEGRRELNHRSTTTYLRRVLAGESPVAEVETLSAEDRARERLVFGLRRLQGVDERAFHTETGFSIAQLVGSVLPKYLKSGWLERRDGKLRLTREGLMLSDGIWPDFL